MLPRICVNGTWHRTRIRTSDVLCTGVRRRPFSDQRSSEQERLTVQAAHPRDTPNQQPPPPVNSNTTSTERVVEPLRDAPPSGSTTNELVTTSYPTDKQRTTGDTDGGKGPFNDGFPHAASYDVSIPRVPFSTHQFVKRLEGNGIERTKADEIMKMTRDLLLHHERRAGTHLTTRQDLEDSAYLLTAAMSELQTESQVRSRNDGIALRSMTASLQRDTHAISQKLNEDMAKLKSDIQLDMNQRKEETSSQLKGLDMKIMELNSKFTVLLGEVRTEIETTRWVSTRRVMAALVIIVVAVVASFTSGSSAAASSKSKDGSKSSPPSVEELGIQRLSTADDTEMNAPPAGSAGWFTWSAPTASSSSPTSPTKRVGEEEDETS